MGMNTMNTYHSTAINSIPTDAVLVSQSLTGDSSAYGCLVERYQNLACSIALSCCGDIKLSEDIAQEGFIQAWKKLSNLQEPEKFKSWLCRIVRHIALRSGSRWQRDVSSDALELKEAVEPCSQESDPSQLASFADELEMMHQTMETLPENYRAPLVLFYREFQSVQEIAQALDLSEDAVKQRLKRGREMLKGRIEAMVQNVLQASRPGAMFTASVLGGISALSATASATTVTSTVSASMASSGVGVGTKWGSIIPPLGLTFLAGWFSARTEIQATRSPEERKLYLKHQIHVGLVMAAIFISSQIILLTELFGRVPVIGKFGFIILFLIVLLGVGWVMWCHWRYQQQVKQLRIQQGTSGPGRPMIGSGKREPQVRAIVFAVSVTLLGVPTLGLAYAGAHIWLGMVVGLMVSGAGTLGFLLGGRPCADVEWKAFSIMVSVAGGSFVVMHLLCLEALGVLVLRNQMLNPALWTILLAMLILTFFRKRMYANQKIRGSSS